LGQAKGLVGKNGGSGFAKVGKRKGAKWKIGPLKKNSTERGGVRGGWPWKKSGIPSIKGALQDGNPKRGNLGKCGWN